MGQFKHDVYNMKLPLRRANHTNGTEGYLPTEKAEKGGHYSAFISSGTVGHEGGELLVRNTLNYINKMWKEDEK